jgi:hypothetical protein
MQRSNSKIFFISLTLFACGSPGELGDGFPPYEQTGYADGNGGSPIGVSGAGGGQPQAGTGGNPGQGGTSSGTGGTSSVGNGGSGPGGGTGGGNPGGAGTGGAGAGGAGGGEPTGQCPDDISELFNRPITEGGCDGQGCHIPGPTGTPPDLVSPDPLSRLLDVQSSCQGRPYVGAGDSFLAEKITVATPSCGGAAMPFFMANALSAEDEACILQWIDEVTGN